MPDLKKTAIFGVFLRLMTLLLLLSVAVVRPVGAQTPALPLAAPPAITPAAPASMQDIYRVDDIRIDIAGNPVTARDRAVEQAQQQAFRTLLGRLTLEGAQPPTPGASDLAKMVQDLEIVKEKVSPNHYSATYNIRFRPEASRAFMTGKNLAVAETARAPMLVIPVWVVDGRKKLWDVDNPWRDAWRQQAGRDPLLPMVVPQGSVEDVTTGTADEMMAGKPEILDAWRTRYNTDSILVAVATQDITTRRLAIDVRDFGIVRSPVADPLAQQPGLADAHKMTLPPMADETDAALYLRGVTAVQERIRDQWKQQTAMNPEAGESTLLVSVPVRGIEDWIAIQRRLNSQKNVLRTDVQALSPRSVRLLVHHYGTIDQLRVVMGEYGLELAPVAGRLQPVLVPATGANPAPVAGTTVPDAGANGSSVPEAPGAGPVPALSAEPEWVLQMRDRAL